jgi:hypothetical protein
MEPRSFANLGLKVDRTAVRSHNTITNAQAKTCPLALRLGGEKRIEDLGRHGRVDATAGISYFDCNTVTVGLG